MKAVAAPFATLYAVVGLAVVSTIALIVKRKKK
jgi:LPXTG-motif cell wall-anchored protein